MAKHGGWLHKLAMFAALPGAGVQAALPVPPTRIGINLISPAYYKQSRAFANLALGSGWVSKAPGFTKLGPDVVDKDGNLKMVPGGQPVMRMLSQPNAGKGDATIRCTYSGHGDIRPSLGVQDVKSGQGNFTFRWRSNGYKNSLIMLKVFAVDPADPIRNLDCREADLPANQRFDAQFLDFVRPFKVIRFMDWQNINANRPVTWASRHTPASLNILEDDGVAIEDMVGLVTQTGADAWFNMPWNADDDYVRHFAQYVHDHLPRGQKVYVELGNEVWNQIFLMSRQAAQEGQAEGLAPDPDKGRLFRYAERLTQVMDIWAKVFADRPGQLVRVANWQNYPHRVDMVLGYKDTAKHVDALATAPYFGYDFRKNPPGDGGSAFDRLNNGMDQSLGIALESKAVAAKYGKRYIAYEAGQHVVLDDQALAEQLQRDPRMYDAYKRYLNLWRRQIGDTIMLYASVQPIGKNGSWGLLEYLGQPLAEAPKMRAVSEVLHDLQR